MKHDPICKKATREKTEEKEDDEEEQGGCPAFAGTRVNAVSNCCLDDNLYKA